MFVLVSIGIQRITGKVSVKLNFNHFANQEPTGGACRRSTAIFVFSSLSPYWFCFHRNTQTLSRPGVNFVPAVPLGGKNSPKVVKKTKNLQGLSQK